MWKTAWGLHQSMMSAALEWLAAYIGRLFLLNLKYNNSIIAFDFQFLFFFSFFIFVAVSALGSRGMMTLLKAIFEGKVYCF